MIGVVGDARRAGLSGFTDDYIMTVDSAVSAAVMSRCGVGQSAKHKDRMQVRKQRAAVRKDVCGALGVTLLTLLFNFALNKLINWLIDRWFNHVANLSLGDWCGVASLQTVYTGAARPSPSVGFWWSIVDCIL